jgi:hypothetical protein
MAPCVGGGARIQRVAGFDERFSTFVTMALYRTRETLGART